MYDPLYTFCFIPKLWYECKNLRKFLRLTLSVELYWERRVRRRMGFWGWRSTCRVIGWSINRPHSSRTMNCFFHRIKNGECRKTTDNLDLQTESILWIQSTTQHWSIQIFKGSLHCSLTTEYFYTKCRSPVPNASFDTLLAKIGQFCIPQSTFEFS